MSPPGNRVAWSRSALNALELLYSAGWKLEAIALHCGGIDSTARTRHAIFAKAKAIGLKKGRVGGAYKARGNEYDEELQEMMRFDLTIMEMASDLTRRHKLNFSHAWVWRRISRMRGATVVAYRARTSERRSRGNRRRYRRSA